MPHVTDSPALHAAVAQREKSGPQRALEKLGLLRDVDLALHLPLRYEDETRVVPIAQAREAESVQVEGVVIACRVEQRSRRQLLVTLQDGSGELVLRFLNFYASQQKTMAPGKRLRVRGELRGGFLGREMVHPVVKVVDAATPLAATLTPVYPTSAQLPQAYLRKAVAGALARAPLGELLPEGCVPAGLPSLREALLFLHQPLPDTHLESLEDRSHPAWQRLKFEELLAQQLSQAMARRERAALVAPAFAVHAFAAHADGLRARLLAALPFTPTAAQYRVEAEISRDLAQAQPMHRLLQGDVGSGKTVVAALAATTAIDAGWQCALMAPTEILAEQHFRKLIGWLEPLGVQVAWLTGSRKGKARAQMLALAATGAAGLVVGTHAMIQDDVSFARLGLAIVDEQHRFGVAQRLQLRRKLAGSLLEPHLLMMSATPIPRTLAMSYFADLAVSTIDELPPGRTPVLTKLFSHARRDAVIDRVRVEVAQGRQVYWVCPLIDDNAKEGGDEAAARVGGGGHAKGPGRGRSEALELQNVTETHALLTQALPGVVVGLLHGRMPAAEKQAVMARFTQGEISLLVATTVIEVGVDVPNASLMVVEHAERFGLSQLHQLRGRVGRGAAASVCVLLFMAPLSDAGKARLKALVETQDGFEIARRDLEIRGPGEFMGSRQSGAALLRFADPEADAALLERARRLAPALLASEPMACMLHVERWLGGRFDYLKA